MDDMAHERAPVASFQVLGRGLLDLVCQRRVEQSLEARNGGWCAARTRRFADDGFEVCVDFLRSVLGERDGCAMGCSAISRVFDVLYEWVVGSCYSVTCHRVVKGCF